MQSPAQVVVDVNGVGYELQISLNTYSAISNRSEGQLFTYLHITENGQTLFGFAEKAEKDLFLQLIGVSGVGATTARMMLSNSRPEELVQALVQGNIKLLEGIKGIGKKTAERLVLELRDKLGKQIIEQPTLVAGAPGRMDMDAVQALMALGIARPAAETAVKKVFNPNNAEILLEDLIKTALKNL